MRLALLTALTMIAFAANSVLTRAAIDGGYMDPASFATLRVLAGAAILSLIILVRGGALPLWRRNRLPGAISLVTYMIGFSLAYMTLDAGLGALILFGVVQITMFAHGARTGTRPSMRQMAGAAIAFTGLAIALWPGPGGMTDPLGAALMVLAGLGWAAYSIIGRRATDPLAANAANFVLCFPCMLVLLLAVDIQGSGTGVLLALVCGALTSGMGYSLWYHVLPQMASATGAIVQLSVPVIAILGGAVFLGEAVTGIVMIAAVLVVGGIGWAVTDRGQA